jgi:hypothetical protein
MPFTRTQQKDLNSRIAGFHLLQDNLNLVVFLLN